MSKPIEATLLFHLDFLSVEILLLLAFLLLVQLLDCYLLRLAGSIPPGPVVDSAPFSFGNFVAKFVHLRLHGFGLVGGLLLLNLGGLLLLNLGGLRPDLSRRSSGRSATLPKECAREMSLADPNRESIRESRVEGTGGVQKSVQKRSEAHHCAFGNGLHAST